MYPAIATSNKNNSTLTLSVSKRYPPKKYKANRIDTGKGVMHPVALYSPILVYYCRYPVAGIPTPTAARQDSHSHP